MVEEVDWEPDSPVGEASSASGLDRNTVKPLPWRDGDGPSSAKAPRGDGKRPQEEDISNVAKAKQEVPEGFVPPRIQKVLDEAIDFKSFKEERVFRYLHLFSGPQDNLAEALKSECKSAGLKIEVESVDIRIDKNHDLKDTSKWSALDKRVIDGDFDGSHAGFPCGSFSMLRWR